MMMCPKCGKEMRKGPLLEKAAHFDGEIPLF